MKIAILGRNGFIGKALSQKLISLGLEVTSFPTKDTDILYHLASPVHIPFEQNPDYHMQEMFSSFTYLLPFCRDNGIKFIYPSSALVYEKDTVFTRYKKIMEMYASCYENTLGLRIFPTYGIGEQRTAIYQWCTSIKSGQSPTVYGDGTQKRDFIYITDVVDAIIKYSFSDIVGVRDVGAGKPVSFNHIVETVNTVLGTNLKTKYINKPQGYSEGIVCKDPVQTKIDIEEGVRRVCESL